MLMRRHAPTLTHRFLAHLHHERKLLRVYTQNVDGLELHAGIAPSKVVQCHGSFASAKCIDCTSVRSNQTLYYRGAGGGQKLVLGEVTVRAASPLPDVWVV